MAFVTKFTFFLLLFFFSDIYYQMFFVSFSMSRRPGSWVVLSRLLTWCGFMFFCLQSCHGCTPFCTISDLSFFHTSCLHFGLIPRGLCVCIRLGSMFPRLFQLSSFLLGFSYRTSVLFVGLVFGRLVTSSSVSINEFFNKAFVWFVCMSVIS